MNKRIIAKVGLEVIVCEVCWSSNRGAWEALLFSTSSGKRSVVRGQVIYFRKGVPSSSSSVDWRKLFLMLICIFQLFPLLINWLKEQQSPKSILMEVLYLNLFLRVIKFFFFTSTANFYALVRNLQCRDNAAEQAISRITSHRDFLKLNLIRTH